MDSHAAADPPPAIVDGADSASRTPDANTVAVVAADLDAEDVSDLHDCFGLMYAGSEWASDDEVGGDVARSQLSSTFCMELTAGRAAEAADRLVRPRAFPSQLIRSPSANDSPACYPSSQPSSRPPPRSPPSAACSHLERTTPPSSPPPLPCPPSRPSTPMRPSPRSPSSPGCAPSARRASRPPSRPLLGRRHVRYTAGSVLGAMR